MSVLREPRGIIAKEGEGRSRVPGATSRKLRGDDEGGDCYSGKIEKRAVGNEH